MTLTTTRSFQFLFPRIRWVGPTTSVFLTFDDGPHPEATPRVLDILAARSIKAAFFLIGANVQKFPALARRIASEGHLLANHTYDHSLMLFKQDDHHADQIVRARETIRDATGVHTRHFRPPYGWMGPAAYRTARNLGHEIVLWDVDSGDFRGSARKSIVRTTRSVRPGSIVLFHDNEHTATIIGDLLTGVLDRLSRHRHTFDVLPS